MYTTTSRTLTEAVTHDTPHACYSPLACCRMALCTHRLCTSCSSWNQPGGAERRSCGTPTQRTARRPDPLTSESSSTPLGVWKWPTWW